VTLSLPFERKRKNGEIVPQFDEETRCETNFGSF